MPLSLIGVLLALLITGSTLNIFSVIGFIMLMGLVTKNAILLVDFTNQRQREGLGQFEALMEAGQVRLRPILMTTLAMVFGMLPMAIGMGDGGESQAPMGRAVIGGVHHLDPVDAGGGAGGLHLSRQPGQARGALLWRRRP